MLGPCPSRKPRPHGGGRRGPQRNSHLQRSCGRGTGGCGQGREQLWRLVVEEIVSPCWCWTRLYQQWCSQVGSHDAREFVGSAALPAAPPAVPAGLTLPRAPPRAQRVPVGGTRRYQRARGDLAAGDGGDRDIGFVMAGVRQDQGPKATGLSSELGFQLGYSKMPHPRAGLRAGARTGSFLPGRRWKVMKNQHLFSCSTSGPGAWDTCQHPSPCSCASHVPHSPQPHALLPPAMPWGQTRGDPPPKTCPGKGPVGGHRFTPQILPMPRHTPGRLGPARLVHAPLAAREPRDKPEG